MQHKLATWTEAGPNRRFDRLLRLIADREWLAEAARIVLAPSGARTPGIDGMDKRRMQAGQHGIAHLVPLALRRRQCIDRLRGQLLAHDPTHKTKKSVCRCMIWSGLPCPRQILRDDLLCRSIH